MRVILFAATTCLLFLCSHLALADNADWLDGVFQGNAVDLFAGQKPAIISFVKSHPYLARSATLDLTPCPNDGSQNLCSLNQTMFILDYISAFYNDHNSQQNVAYDLSGDGMPPKTVDRGNAQVGVKPDPAWGCGWHIATLISGGSDVNETDLDSYKEDCESLPADEQSQAEGFAVSFLVPEIHAHIAKGTIPFALVDDYPGSP